MNPAIVDRYAMVSLQLEWNVTVKQRIKLNSKGGAEEIPPTTNNSETSQQRERKRNQAIGNEIEFISKLIKIKTEIVRLLGTCAWFCVAL